ncbi:MAG: 3-isopropylmalate dehydratase large subunit [Alphaproteobacteria bacterium]|nr:3-isopropylmalate dehydratase large subunit [Alphaproteobacteria bacterium]
MGQTLVEKVIARAAGRDTVRPGEIVTCTVDLAMFHDSSGPRRVAPRLEALGAKVWDPSRVVVVTDHFVPAVDVESANILKLTREWVRDNGIAHFYDMEGICHIVLAENGHLTPGLFAVGGDSHSTNGGAFACYMAGYGATEMTGVMVTGEIWVKVPETIRVNWSGAFGTGVAAKDVMLHLCAELGMDNNFKIVEYGGDTVAAMDMNERMVLTNMAAELGAESGIIGADKTTVGAIEAAGGKVPEDALDWVSDDDASYSAEYAFDAAALDPMVAAPHTPANSQPVGAYGKIAIDQCYIGACVGAKYTDLKMAAAVLRGRKVAETTRLLIAPASTRATKQAAADGTLAVLTEAGAILMPTGCGACPGMGAGILADGETCISSTNRNFRGRMGSASAEIYLGSPYSVAAAAVTGCITDPREFLS